MLIENKNAQKYAAAGGRLSEQALLASRGLLG